MKPKYAFDDQDRLVEIQEPKKEEIDDEEFEEEEEKEEE